MVVCRSGRLWGLSRDRLADGFQHRHARGRCQDGLDFGRCDDSWIIGHDDPPNGSPGGIGRAVSMTVTVTVLRASTKRSPVVGLDQSVCHCCR